jgi:hypothetical protein
MAQSNFPFQVTEHIIDGQHIREYPRATATEDAPLKLLIKKYTPLDNPNPQPGDITLIGFHGTGIPKVSINQQSDWLLSILICFNHVGALRAIVGRNSCQKQRRWISHPRYLDG